MFCVFKNFYVFNKCLLNAYPGPESALQGENNLINKTGEITDFIKSIEKDRYLKE